MGKHLAEHMVAEYQAKGLPVAIVRPSLVSGLATAPYPGFTGRGLESVTVLAGLGQVFMHMLVRLDGECTR